MSRCGLWIATARNKLPLWASRNYFLEWHYRQAALPLPLSYEGTSPSTSSYHFNLAEQTTSRGPFSLTPGPHWIDPGKSSCRSSRSVYTGHCRHPGVAHVCRAGTRGHGTTLPTLPHPCLLQKLLPNFQVWGMIILPGWVTLKSGAFGLVGPNTRDKSLRNLDSYTTYLPHVMPSVWMSLRLIKLIVDSWGWTGICLVRLEHCFDSHLREMQDVLWRLVHAYAPTPPSQAGDYLCLWKSYTPRWLQHSKRISPRDAVFTSRPSGYNACRKFVPAGSYLVKGIIFTRRKRRSW